MKMTTMMDAPSFLNSRKFRSFPDKSKKPRKDHHKKLFIPVHTFEVLAFPVRVRPVESLGDAVHGGGVRIIRL